MDAPQQQTTPGQSNSRTEKKNRAGYIIAGISAVLLVVAALIATDSSTNKRKSDNLLAEKLTEERKVLSNEIKLHTLFNDLQQLDARYGTLISSNGDPAEIKMLEEKIGAAESTLAKTVTSMEKESNTYNGWSNVVMLDSIASSFKTALGNRRYLSGLRSAITGRAAGLSVTDRNMVKLQQDLDKKTAEVAILEQKLRAKSIEMENGTMKTGKQNFSSKEKTELVASLKEEEDRSAGLVDLNSGLKKENQSLTDELNKFKRSASSNDAASISARNKMIQLQTEIADLNAELNFARVDCSLSRADAKKIISNSRQRQELLEDALKTLQVLASSDNNGVKQKAKDKIKELNQIASTVRD
jgi:hypothetical protein